MTDRFHLLRLAKRSLRFHPLRQFGIDALFQRVVEKPQLFRDLLGLSSRLQQVTLVAPPLRGVENRDAVAESCPVCRLLLRRIDEDGERLSILADEFEGNLVDEALHLQKRREMRVVKDLPR